MRLSVALLATSVAAFTPQPRRSATNMALRVERSVGEGLRRLYRLPKLITNAKNADDIDYTETILKPMESLWASVRLPLLIPVLMLAYECRTAVVAAFGAVQGLFAAAPEPVAEPAKKGLAALFGR